MKYFKYFFISTVTILLFSSCSRNYNDKGFTIISQAEAYEMMKDENVIILDVREEDEKEDGYIKNSILVPVGKIKMDIENIIPDKSKTILVYCRSGRRSKVASEILAELKYKNVYEFGGINTWKYGLIK